MRFIASGIRETKAGKEFHLIIITMTNLNQKPASIFHVLLLLFLLVHSESVNCQSSGQPSILAPPTLTTTTTTTTTTPSTKASSETTIAQATTTPKPATISERSGDVVSETTTLSPQTSPLPATGEVLLSGNEFVDFTEAPIVLFDGITNETIANNDTDATAAADKNTDATSSLQVPTLNGTTTATPSIETTTVKNNITSSAESGTESPPVIPTTLVEDAGEGESEETLGGDDYEPLDEAREPTKLAFDPPKNVSQYMDYIERLFHDLRHQITDLFEPHIPQLIRTSQMVELTGSCSYDMLRMALALRQFEPWALRMIDSSGKVPEGIFEGSFTALGSYDECLGTVFASSSGQGASGGGGQQQQTGGTGNQQFSSSQQQPATQGKYCLVNVSPFLPPKPPADRVELMFQEEANRRNYTKDDQFSRLSPMFYYMKFRIGVCIPSTCIESDMESISNALSSSLRLNITIPHCRVKHDQPLTNAQLIGGLAFALVAVAVLGATLMDYWRRKLEHLDDMKSNIFVQLNVAAAGGNEKSINAAAGYPLPAVLISNCDSKTTTSSIATKRNFNDRFRKHWSWMSFSLLTNYKLYFTHKRAPSFNEDQSEGSKWPANQRNQTPSMIQCLNGIRVLSLCWVIVANSYITLDPRATKRLTKTRDAPKDFLFQLVAQASLAIETFFFLSGILVSMSFAKKLNPPPSRGQNAPEANTASREMNNKAQEQTQNTLPLSTPQQPSYPIRWLQFYVHRYIRMTPATMLVIAFTMFAFRYGDGPLWFEATNKAHMSCSENWWRHLLHVANFIDTRQMCFIHYWYIAADMQLFLFAPILMFLIYKSRRIGYAIATLIGLASMGFVFYTTYIRNLPPTLLFYNSDPESRREFGNTIMTKPLTHALPYMVGMLLGKWLTTRQMAAPNDGSIVYQRQGDRSLATLLGLTATIVALAEVFLPYKWNNSHLPTRFMAALYAAVFRFCWSLVLAYLVMACAHPPGRRCRRQTSGTKSRTASSGCCGCIKTSQTDEWKYKSPTVCTGESEHNGSTEGGLCLCGSGGNIVNRLLSLSIFTHLSKLSFVAYLIHLPLMSVFIAQTRGLFAFSHTLVIHLALSYLVMTFILSFVLVHIIEFPFLTFERYLFESLFYTRPPPSPESTEPPNEGSKAAQEMANGKGLLSGSSKIIRPKSNDNNRGGDKGDYYCNEDDKKNHERRRHQVNQVVGFVVGDINGRSGGGGSEEARDKMEPASYRNHNGGHGETFRISERL